MLREEFEALAGGHHHRGFSLVDEEPGGGAEKVEGPMMLAGANSRQAECYFCFTAGFGIANSATCCRFVPSAANSEKRKTSVFVSWGMSKYSGQELIRRKCLGKAGVEAEKRSERVRFRSDPAIFQNPSGVRVWREGRLLRWRAHRNMIRIGLRMCSKWMRMRMVLAATIQPIVCVTWSRRSREQWRRKNCGGSNQS
jgi:hypothetical protein